MRAVADGRLTRRGFVARAAALGFAASSAAALLAACGSGGGDSSTKPSPLDTMLPSELKIYNWDGYIAPKMLKAFEKETGVKPVVDSYDSVPESFDKLKAGAVYDVVFSTNSFLRTFVDAGLLQPLQMDLLPNFANVTDEILARPPYDSGAGGKKYSVPYMFGTSGFGVRLDKVTDAVDSWDTMWDKAYKGQIAMLDDSAEGIGAGMIAAGLKAGASDRASIDKATAKLKEQRPLVDHYSSSKITEDMTNGLPLRHCWDGDAILAINTVGLSKVRYVLPKEGFLGWADSVCVHAKAPNPYAAHLFLDMLLDAKMAGMNANYTGYQPGAAAADPYIASTVQRAMRPTADVLAKAQFVALSEQTIADYEAAWKQVKKG